MDFGFAQQLGFRGLTFLTFLPIAGALVMLLFMRKRPNAYKATALITTLVTLALSIYLATQFKTGTAAFQFQEDQSWIGSLGIHYHVGVDGISMLLIILTTLLSTVAILGTWNSIKDRGLAFFISLLVLEAGMIGVFVSMDLFLFYMFWEIQMIPMYFIIGLWGGTRRIYAAIKFFLYTFVGSVLMLVAILTIVWWNSRHNGVLTFDILTLMKAGFSPSVAGWAFAAFFIAFAIKVPMFPVHTWLPDAHTEAPTAGSVILAGVLLKMGVYGMIRFNIGLFPQIAVRAVPVVLVLSVIAIVYGAAMSLIQPDMKRLVAYSSVSHMGFITAGLFVFNLQGVEGSILQMVSHGILTGALFMMVGFFYDRTAYARGGGVLQPVRRRQPGAARAERLPGRVPYPGGHVPVRQGLRRDRVDRDHHRRGISAVDVPAYDVPGEQPEVAVAERSDRARGADPGAACGHGGVDRHLSPHVPEHDPSAGPEHPHPGAALHGAAWWRAPPSSRHLLRGALACKRLT